MTLRERLQDALPEGHSFELLHLQNIPTEITPIVTASKKYNDATDTSTIKVENFFVLFNNKKAVFAMEVYVYFTLYRQQNEIKGERLLFVSKADTSGYSDVKFSVKSVTTAILSYLLSVDPKAYLTRVKPMTRKYDDLNNELITIKTATQDALRILAKRLRSNGSSVNEKFDKDRLYSSFDFPKDFSTKICLFTRPAPQYLFSKSSENPHKHVLSGEGLLKWWLSILDDIAVNYFTEDTQAKLRIPGEDTKRVQKYLVGTKFQNWSVGDVFANSSNSLAAYAIPLFPDDPKSRFLHELVEENRIKTTSLKSFWIELQERQEFKLSVMVSVIGIIGHTKPFPQSVIRTAETLVTKSKKQFSYIKSYITGEEFNKVEGAHASYQNVKDYYHARLHADLVPLEGKKKSIMCKTNLQSHQPVITMLQPRKKRKQ
ncbi:hypothetical protein KAFR_0E01680 [Kazachstania africana CBS 2517]|uniref:histone acetyltransferase n=1 Tax=Kazachstania africana (strain ATCC 22294 / BCRC 22015 / CBS 2517 / CECT 1963 / NBRC 1671 / NRRL Y-8276) TaxID=1071382 RepID=H2AVC2_KAZAF|nr:hypothetical protein KAFR_0E01680 [Kazachstania africana CBS 2517]CCF58322.1 hypothetical protein KAFR_0E01680 [Kazachstania africana CBS 2517]